MWKDSISWHIAGEVIGRTYLMVGGLGGNLVWCKWGVVKIAASAVYGLGRVGLGEMGGVL